MSNHWSVYCADCDEGHGSPRNHAAEGMAALVSHRTTWELVAEQVPEVMKVVYEGTCLYGYEVDPAWFLKHKGHTLVSRSEYGYFLRDCATHFKCGECSTGHICRRRTGHEGPHSGVRDYDPGQDEDPDA